MDLDRMEEAGINPYTDLLTEEDYRRIFGAEVKHPLYRHRIMSVSIKKWGLTIILTIYLSNNPRDILQLYQKGSDGGCPFPGADEKNLTGGRSRARLWFG